MVYQTNDLRIEKYVYFWWKVLIWSYVFWKTKQESFRPGILHVFYSAWKEATHKPSKVTTAKNVFPSVCVKTLIFINVYRYQGFVQPPSSFTTAILSFWKHFERSPYLIFYLHSKTTMLITKVPKWSFLISCLWNFLFLMLQFFSL